MKLKVMRAIRDVYACDIAKEIGINKQIMSYIEHGKCMPTVKQMKTICKMLDCKVTDIYDKSELNFLNIGEN